MTRNHSRHYIIQLMLYIALIENRYEYILSNAQSTESTTGTTAVPQTFTEEPKDVTVKEKGTAILPCVIKNQVGQVRWTKDTFGLGEDRNLTGFPRYTIIGDKENGNYTLQIDPVLLEDEAWKMGDDGILKEGSGPGKYQCQVSAGNGGSPPEIRSKTAKLTVTVAPEPPIILNGDVLKTIGGTEVEIKCSSRGGKPSAKIKWFDADDKEITSTVSTDTEPYENSKRITVVSTLKFTPDGKSDHNTTRLCKATHDEISMNVSIQLLVEYSPKITLTMTSETTPILEGQDVIFNCTAISNPPEVNYRWFIDDAIVPEVHGTEYTIPGVDRKLNKKSVKCEVRNVIGSNTKSQALSIHYSPQFLKTPEDYSGKKGQTAKLICKVDANPTAKYIWFKNGDEEIVHSNDGSKSELSLKISEETVGKYICRALVEGFPGVEGSAEVLMKGAPHFYEKSEVQYGQEGTDVKIVCNAFSIPPPKKVTWNVTSTGRMVDSSSLTNYNDKYVVMDENRKDGIKSTLIINNALHPTDFTEYKCAVENALGKDEFVITLKRERSLPLIIILSAVVGGILVTVLTILVMILGRRSTALSLRVVNINQPEEDGEESKSIDTTTESSLSTSSSTTRSSVKSDDVKYDKSYGLDLDDPLLRSTLPESVPPSIIDVYDELLGNAVDVIDSEYFEDPLDNNYEALSKGKKKKKSRKVYQSAHYKRNQPVPPPRKYRTIDRRLVSNPARQKTNAMFNNKRPSRASSSNVDSYQYSVHNDDLFHLGGDNNIYSDASISHI